MPDFMKLLASGIKKNAKFVISAVTALTSAMSTGLTDSVDDMGDELGGAVEGLASDIAQSSDSLASSAGSAGRGIQSGLVSGMTGMQSKRYLAKLDEEMLKEKKQDTHTIYLASGALEIDNEAGTIRVSAKVLGVPDNYEYRWIGVQQEAIPIVFNTPSEGFGMPMRILGFDFATKGTIVEVLQECGNGWLRIKCPESSTGFAYVSNEEGQYAFVGKGLYTVAVRDNLWKIAEKQLGDGTRYTEIRQLNGLTCNIIRVGMPLILPEK